MKRLLLATFVTVIGMASHAEDSPLWMRRYCAISPDGGQIAFTYKGDIYTVPVEGDKALQITSNQGHDTHPVWSPDGKNIAFASDREGSMDIFIVGKDGGVPRRLTTHSGNEVPYAFSDNSHVLFQAVVMPDAQDMTFPSSQFPQIYEVGIEGGRPVMFSSIPMEDISVSPDGKSLLYHDKKGYEDAWRKHHTSSITRDIWLCTEQEGTEKSYRKITSFDGEDRTPVWTPDGKSFYYLSEREGSFNIYKSDLDGKNITRLTSHTDHPVRFLSVASNGTLCYGFNGEIYTVKEGESPKKVNVSIVSDSYDKHLVKWLKSSGATEISVSPEGKEIAFIMRGDVYVTSTEYKTTKQITDTPEQERNIDFSPDGRSIVYASERNGLWQIYQTSLVNKEDKQFVYANEFKEERLVNSAYTSFQPQYSPDGKEVAFLENRTTLRVLNLKTKAVRTVMDGKYEYSYSDGDQWFEWSPDSRWLLSGYIGHGGWNNNDVALVNASGNGEIHNLTQSGYTDGDAKWVLGGKAMIWKSDRAGYRSHGSWGSEDDVYIMFFDLDAYERFRMSKEELALVEEKEKKDKEDAENKESDKKKGKKKDNGKDKEDEVKPLKFDLENCRDRIIRLTVNSSRLGDAVLTEKGDKLYYQAAFEDGYDLWMHDLKEDKTSIVMKNIGYGAMMTDKKLENLYLCNSSIKKVNMEKGESENVEFSATFNYRPYDERLYMFNHIWKQVEDKFYVADLHGVLRSRFLSFCFKLSGVKVAYIDKERGKRKKLTSVENKVLTPQTTSFERYALVFKQLGFSFPLSFHSIFGNEKGNIENIRSVVGYKEVHDKWIGVAPFAAHQGKVYPIELQEQVVRSLSSRENVKLFLFGGGKKEVAQLEQWQQAYPRVVSVAGKLKMAEELALMSHLDVMLAMDSGNMHLASLVGTPVVSVWGATHPYAGFMGWGQSEKNAVQISLPCRPCSIFGNKPCIRGDYACLRQITPNQIIEKVESLL